MNEAKVTLRVNPIGGWEAKNIAVPRWPMAVEAPVGFIDPEGAL